MPRARGQHTTKGDPLVSYPVTFEADYLEPRNRLTAFFRLLLAIPLAIWAYLTASSQRS